MSDWGVFQSQFYEAEWERRVRWAKRKRELTQQGKCWQCAEPVEKCTCPNLKHEGPKK